MPAAPQLDAQASLATDAGLDGSGAASTTVGDAGWGVATGTTAPPVCARADDGASSARQAKTTYAVVRRLRPTFPLFVRADQSAKRMNSRRWRLP